MVNSLNRRGAALLSQMAPAHASFTGQRFTPFARTSGQPRPRDWFRIENLYTTEDGDVAKIYIYDEIGFWGTTAQDFVEQITQIDKDKIHLHLNSPGGAIFDGIAIYNALKNHKAEVTVYVDSLAASAASFIAQAGDKVFMSRAGTMMIHDGSAVCFGNAQDMRDTADILDKLSNTIADIYAHRAGETQDFWRAIMREESWYNATEAVDVGLADAIVDDSEDSTDTTNKWDLSIFNYSGRENAPSPQKIREMVFANMAHNKETSVKPKNSSPSEAPAETPGETPSETPAETPGETPSETPAETPVEAPEESVATLSSGTSATNSMMIMVNGVAVTDPVAIQAHINGLEGALAEQKKQNRKDFVKALVDNKKIMASQVDTLEAFALDLSDKQYETWCASWDAAPSLGGLATNVTPGTRNHEGVTPTAENELESKLAIAVEIVRSNKRANMPQASLEKTDSYRLLAANNALDRL